VNFYLGLAIGLGVGTCVGVAIMALLTMVRDDPLIEVGKNA
jgi:hypothetical protein